jgi:hypothetical protein
MERLDCTEPAFVPMHRACCQRSVVVLAMFRQNADNNDCGIGFRLDNTVSNVDVDIARRCQSEVLCEVTLSWCPTVLERRAIVGGKLDLDSASTSQRKKNKYSTAWQYLVP